MPYMDEEGLREENTHVSRENGERKSNDMVITSTYTITSGGGISFHADFTGTTHMCTVTLLN